MEKIFIKPISKEISIKGLKDNGTVDLFSYDYDADDLKRRLGSLYVIGNIKTSAEAEPESGDENDMNYATNLVASLAKREYYSNPSLPPREAFYSALKKVNDVIEEFFKNKGAKINIGIFAISGENINVSKVGKFKIMLARGGKIIDILNDIQLFSKEHSREKEFSNVISGKINEGDRILAFYPSRAVASREKTLRETFLKTTRDQFIKKVESIKEEKRDFGYGALYIDINEVMEATIMPRPQPPELKENGESTVPVMEAELAAENSIDPGSRRQLEGRDKNNPLDELGKTNRPILKTEIPRIISTEFSLGKKDNVFMKNMKRLGIEKMRNKAKFGIIAVAVLLLILGGSLVKPLIFVSPEQKLLSGIIEESQENLKLAKAKISQNDPYGARIILADSLGLITAAGVSSDDSVQTQNEIIAALDNLDNAAEAGAALFYGLPEELGEASLILSSGENIFLYVKSKDGQGINYLAQVGNEGIEKQYDLGSFNAGSILGGPEIISLFDPSSGTMKNILLKDGKIGNTAGLPDGIIDAYVYNDNLYLLQDNGILKVSDAALGKDDSSQWLKDGSQLAADSILLAVDGNIYVVDKLGTVTTYYLGKKETESRTSILPDPDGLLLTGENSPNLYLVNKKLNRIYVINKESGGLVGTIKTGSSQPIISAAVDENDNIFILSNDNKIWRIK